MKLPQVFEKYRFTIDAELRLALAEHQSPMYDMMRYHLGWVNAQGHPQESSAGKVLRPTLCLLACEAVGGDFEKALPAAAAIELTHNFSLIHDDIQDDDRERRHRPTVWSIWGKPQAINVGTAMRVLASLALLRLGERDVPVQKQLYAQRLLDEACLTMIEGQCLDISYETRLDITVDDYLGMINRKTAVLLGCSLQLGALLGTDDDLLIQRLLDFGRNLGLAFQIRDDVLGIWGEQEKTGKPLGSDIRRRKKSFPVVYALERANGETRGKLANIYQKELIDDGDVATVLTILDAVSARLNAEQMAGSYHERAMRGIVGLALWPSARRDLEEMAYFLAERDF
ncbi:polyprenyl synthetase family protein [Chloroflexota bacterium]